MSLSSRKPLSALQCNQPSFAPPSSKPSKPPLKTAPKRAATTATPDDAVEWDAIAGLVSAALLSPEDEASALSRAHGRMLCLARQDDFDAFRQRLHREVSQGLLCLHPDRDVLHDFGLQDELRGLLGCFDSAWLRPALAAVLRRPPSAGLPSLTAAIIGVGGGGGGPKRTLKADEARRACLERIITLIALLDAAALQALLPSPAPPLLSPRCAHTSTVSVVRFFSKFVAKEGDLAVHLRRLGAQFSYEQTAALAATLPPPPLESAALLAPALLVDGTLLVRCLQLAHPTVATSLARRLRAPVKSTRQAAHNASCLLAALGAAGAPASTLLDAEAIGRLEHDARRAALWAAAEALLLPALAPEAEVRAECARLCRKVRAQQSSAQPLPHLTLAAPPGAHTAGVLSVEQLVETAGCEGALLLWVRCAAWRGGLPEEAAAAVDWATVFGWSGAALRALLRAYGETEASLCSGAAARLAPKLFEALRGGVPVRGVAERPVTAAAVAILFGEVRGAARRRSAARTLQSRFVLRHARVRIANIRRDKAAARLQARSRGRAAARALGAARAAAASVQRAARRHAARRRMARVRVATRGMQAVSRGHGVRQVLRRWRAAALRLTTATRGWMGRLQARRRRGARTLQAAWRRAMCVKAKRAALSAANVLQAVARGVAARQTLQIARCAATVVQAAIRMAAARAALRSAVGAAVAVQAGWRGAVCRVRLAVQHGAATVIETAARALPCRRALFEAREAAVALQSAVRGAKAAREYAEGRRSIISVQAAARRCLAFKVVRVLRASRLVQSAWRGVQGRRVLRVALRAVVTLQAAARRVQCRRWLVEQRCAVTTVQAASRGLAARTARARALVSLARIQAAARRLLAARLATRLRACLLLQAATRGHCARLAVRLLRSARACQALRRGAVERRRFLHARTAAWKLRLHFKAYRARRTRRRAATFVQRTLRQHQASGALPGRRGLIHACHDLAFRTASVQQVLAACLSLKGSCSHPTARVLVLDFGAVPPLLRTIGSCNRSPPCLLVLDAALHTLRQLVADAACLPRITPCDRFAAVLLKVLVSHWGAPAHFKLAGSCLLHAAGDARLKATLRASANANKSLVARLYKASKEKKRGGADPAMLRRLACLLDVANKDNATTPRSVTLSRASRASSTTPSTA